MEVGGDLLTQESAQQLTGGAHDVSVIKMWGSGFNGGERPDGQKRTHWV